MAAAAKGPTMSSSSIIELPRTSSKFVVELTLFVLVCPSFEWVENYSLYSIRSYVVLRLQEQGEVKDVLTEEGLHGLKFLQVALDSEDLPYFLRPLSVLGVLL